MECVSDQVATYHGSKMWVSDDTLAEQSARRQQLLRDGGILPRESISRRSGAVMHGADAAENTSELAELGAERRRARCVGAHRAPLTHAGMYASAAQLPAASRTHAPQISSLGACRHTIGTGRASRLRYYRTGKDTRYSFVPIGSLLGG